MPGTSITYDASTGIETVKELESNPMSADENALLNAITESHLQPLSISMRQCRLYLYAIDSGVTLTTIEQYVLTLTVPAQIEWNTSHEVWRSSPMVEQMRIMFSWTVEQMDQMFRDAELL